MTDTIHYTEMATLAACERRWALRYLDREQEPPGPGMQLGTLIHLWYENWLRDEGAWLPGHWVDEHRVVVDGVPKDEAVVELSDCPEEIVSKAEWLASRFMEHYGDTPPADWEVVDVEPWLHWSLPDGTQVIGRADALIRIDGELWLVEAKSYGRGSRLQLTTISPQETTYLIGAEEVYGERPVGILFEGIYTYQWKPEKPTLAEIEREIIAKGEPVTKKALREAAKAVQAQHPGVERPAADSFQRIWTNRNDYQVSQAYNQLLIAVETRKQISSVDAALANIGPLCSSCGVRVKCFQGLLGDDFDHIEVEGDEGEGPR